MTLEANGAGSVRTKKGKITKITNEYIVNVELQDGSEISGTLKREQISDKIADFVDRIDLDNISGPVEGMPVDVKLFRNQEYERDEIARIKDNANTRQFISEKDSQIFESVRVKEEDEVVIVNEEPSSHSEHEAMLDVRIEEVTGLDTLTISSDEYEDMEIKLLGVDLIGTAGGGYSRGALIPLVARLASGRRAKFDFCSHESGDREGAKGVIYVLKENNKYFNLNKTLLTHRRIGPSGDIETDCPVYRELIGYNVKSDDDFDEIRTTKSEKTSLSNPVERIDDREPPETIHHLTIGDVSFAVPPSAISIETISETESLASLRTQTTAKSQSGHHRKLIEIDMYFTTNEEINGKLVTPHDKPEDMYIMDGKQYYINGLRPLIAQFKRAPFLPVDNAYLNGQHGIFALTMKSITVENMPGFPNTLVARLTAEEFNWEPYMPYEIDFGSTFNWPLFRYYYQKDLLEEPAPRLKRYTGKTSIHDEDIKFYIASEDQLMRARQASREMSDEVDIGDTNYEEIKDLVTDDKMSRRIKDYEVLNKALDQKKIWEEFGPEGDRQATRERDILSGSPFGRVPMGDGLTHEVDVEWHYKVDGDLYFYPMGLTDHDHYIFKDYPDVLNEDNINYNRFIHALVLPLSDEHKAEADRIIEEKGYKLIRSTRRPERTHGTVIPLDKDGQKLIRKINQRGEKAKNERDEKAEEVYEQRKSEFDRIADDAYITEDKLETIEYEIGEITLESISMSQENIVTASHMESQELPTHQYVGSHDVHIRLSLKTTDEEAVENITSLISDTATLCREYRDHIIAGVLEVENDIINMFGVSNVLIKSASINTSEESPELYLIEMILVDFDKTQRSREEVDSIIGPGDEMRGKPASEIEENLDEHMDTIDYEKSTSYIQFEEQMKKAELYPDLELPTYEEVNIACTELFGKAYFKNPTNATYVDPDFYIGVAETESDEIKEETREDGDPKSLLLQDVNYVTQSGKRHQGILRTPQAGHDGDFEIEEETAQDFNEVGETDFGVIDHSEDEERVQNTYDNFPTDWPGPGNERKKLVASALYNATESQVSQALHLEDALIEKIDDTTGLAPDPRVSLRQPTLEEIEAYLGERIVYEGNFQGGLINRKFSSDDREEARKWVKAIIAHESGFHQFVDNENVDDGKISHKKVPAIGPTGDIGLMQINPVDGPFGEIITLGEGPDHPTDTAPGVSPSMKVVEIGYNWMMNLEYGVGYFKDCLTEAKKIENRTSGAVANHIKANPFEWAAVFYNRGVVNGVALAERLIDGGVNIHDEYDLSVLKEIDYFNAVYEKYKEADNLERRYNFSIISYYEMEKIDEQTDRNIARKRPSPDEEGDGEEYGDLCPLGEDAKESFKGSMKDMEEYDMRNRLVRAFPTFQLYVVDEGRWLTWHRLWDNLYGYNSVGSIDLHKSRKLPAQTCKIALNNIYNMINRYTSDQKFEREGYTIANFITPWLSPDEDMIEARQKALTHLMVRPGARLHLRMGYGADASYLPIVFNGTITEVEVQDQALIVAQGDGVELTSTLIQDDPDAASGGLFRPKRAQARNMIMHLLDQRSFYEKWIKNRLMKAVGDNEQHAQGIVHFGNPRHSPFDPEEPEIGQNVFSTSKSYKEDAKRDYPTQAQDWLWLPFGLNEQNEPNMSVYLYDKTPWDIIQIMTLSAPDFVSYVHPFGLRSTLYYGKPYWMLAYKYDYEYEISKDGILVGEKPKEIRKTFQQLKTYHSITDIISNNIKASEKGVYTNIAAMYGSEGADRPDSKEIVSADKYIYPEKQTTKMINTHMRARWYHDNKALASNMGANELANSLREMYKGQLIVMGDPTLKPFDAIFMHDIYNEMSGNAEVEEVVHSFNLETGYTCSITPDPCISVVDKWRINRWGWFASTASVIATRKTLKVLGIRSLKWATKKTIASAKATGASIASTSAAQLVRTELGKGVGYLRGTKIGKSATAYLKTFKSYVPAKQTLLGLGGKTAGSVTKVLGGSTILAMIPKLALLAGVAYVTHGFLEMLRREMQNRQAVVMSPLIQYGKIFYAGIEGHRGLVVGDEPGRVDQLIQDSLGWLVGVDYEHDGSFLDEIKDMQNYDIEAYKTEIAQAREMDSINKNHDGSTSGTSASTTSDYSETETTATASTRHEYTRRLAFKVENGEVETKQLSISLWDTSSFDGPSRKEYSMASVVKESHSKFEKFLKQFRERFGRKPIITSAHRDFNYRQTHMERQLPSPNNNVGASPHNGAIAIDVAANSQEEAKNVANLANELGFGGIAIGRGSNSWFVHVDDAPYGRWRYGDTPIKYDRPQKTEPSYPKKFSSGTKSSKPQRRSP